MTYEPALRSVETRMANRDFLVEWALSEQHRINDLDCPDSKKVELFGELARDLDGACSYQGVEVVVEGAKYQTLPVLDLQSEAEVNEAGGLSYQIRRVFAPDSGQGISAGFAVQFVPVMFEEEQIATRFVVTHLIDTGMRTSEYNNDGYMVTTAITENFAVEDSRLEFLDITDAHDIEKLRMSTELLYEDIDTSLLNDMVPDNKRLATLCQILRDHDFAELELVKQAEVVSYLNSLRLHLPAGEIKTDYALSLTEDSLVLPSGWITVAMQGLVLANYFDILPTQAGMIVDEQEVGLGIRATGITERGLHEFIFPLNQSIEVRELPD